MRTARMQLKRGWVPRVAFCVAAAGLAGAATPGFPQSAAPPAVKELIARLRSAKADERTRAACDLAKRGGKAAPAIGVLIETLADPAPVDRRVCHPESMHESDPTSPGQQAAAALIAIGSPALEPLIAALTDPRWVARKNAAWALGALDDRRAVDPLMRALKDAEAGVRHNAAWALGALDDSRAVPALLSTLSDPDAEARAQAAWALGAIDDRRATEGLSRALKDRDAEVREQAAWALGAIGDPRAAPALVEAARDPEREVRRQVIWALGALSK